MVLKIFFRSCWFVSLLFLVFSLLFLFVFIFFGGSDCCSSSSSLNVIVIFMHFKVLNVKPDSTEV